MIRQYICPQDKSQEFLILGLFSLLFSCVWQKKIFGQFPFFLDKKMNLWLFRVSLCNKYQFLDTRIKANLIILTGNGTKGHRIRGMDFLTV